MASVIGKGFHNSKWLAMALMIIVITGSITNVGSISCGDAITALSQCVPFVLGSTQPPPTAGCCSSAKELEATADTTEKRRALCECFKKVGGSMGVKPDRVKELGQYCQLKISLPADPDFDCSKIQ